MPSQAWPAEPPPPVSVEYSTRLIGCSPLQRQLPNSAPRSTRVCTSAPTKREAPLRDTKIVIFRRLSFIVAMENLVWITAGTVRPESGSSSTASLNSSSESTSQDGASVTDMTVKTRRRPIPRKGHTKSRRGCLNCKRRKVKCQETLPECDHCRRIGLVCEYPDNSHKLLPEPVKALNSTPMMFSMEDLRFFSHFMLHCYPPLPIQGEAVWKDVAAISHSVCAPLGFPSHPVL